MFKGKLKYYGVVVLVLTLCFNFTGLRTSIVSAETILSSETTNEIAAVYNSLPDNLKITSKSVGGENIMLYDEHNRIINEIHSDGRVYLIKWKNDKIVEITDSLGYKTTFDYSDNGHIVENAYFNNNLQRSFYRDNISESSRSFNVNDPLVSKKHEYASKYSEGLIDASVLDGLESNLKISQSKSTDYYVKGKRMNSLISSSDFIYKSDKALTESDIQSFLEKKKSVLKDNIKIYAINSDGNAYDTGRIVKPSTVIHEAAKNERINPKVILVTLQKEASIITSSNTNVNRRAFHYAMGYGATDGGDITTYTGFDKQVELAAKWMYRKWLDDLN